MSGAVAGLIGNLKAVNAPTNLVLNGSATTTSLTNYDWAVRNTSIYKTAPASWKSDFDNGPEQQAFSYTGVNALTVGTRYSASLYVRNTLLQNIYLSVSFGTNVATLTQMPTISGFMKFTLENFLCQTNGTLQIYAFGDFASQDFYVDDVIVIQGATAL
jgi:hypothetical protein